MTNKCISRTAEHVGPGHPDKFCDIVADSILDQALTACGLNTRSRASVRTAIECLAWDNQIVIGGETNGPVDVLGELDVEDAARQVWAELGFGSAAELEVANAVRKQSAEIA